MGGERGTRWWVWGILFGDFAGKLDCNFVHEQRTIVDGRSRALPI